MPKLTKQNGDLIDTVIIEKDWIVIHTTSNIEKCLVHPIVADYIELLESRIEGEIPKLKKEVK